MKMFMSGSTSFLGLKFIELYGDKYEIFDFSKNDPISPIDFTNFDKLKETFNTIQPDVLIHLAAHVDYRKDAGARKAKEINIIGARNLAKLAKIRNIPVIFMSSESIYGGKEETGSYLETDHYKPRSSYAESKMESEKVFIKSKLPHLILRGHRFVGFVKDYQKAKQFPDTIHALEKKEKVHLDSKKFFRPTLINHVCEVMNHYIENDLGNNIILNIGVDKEVTYFELVKDVVKTLGLDENLVKPDGLEADWPQNSTICLDKLHKLGYPTCSYQNLLKTIKQDYENR